MAMNAIVLLVMLMTVGLTKSSVVSPNPANGVCKLAVEIHGYTCEEHLVTTEDGYILSVQRIPDQNGLPKPPVLLHHGIMSDAVSWLTDANSLGFVLIDNGFDVWLMNARGTNYSLGHTSLDSNSSAYWDWSWDELSSYDIPASLKYVNSKTGQKVHYIGFSLGTLTALSAFSNKAEVVNIVRSAGMLSPIAYLGQMPSIFARIAASLFLAEAAYWLGMKEFGRGGGAGLKLIEGVCSKIDCTNIEGLFTGHNCCMNSSIVNIRHQQPTSTKNMVHISQMIRKGTITMFDYGKENNIEHYKQSNPPVHDITSIPRNLPLFLGYGAKDMLADIKDVSTLIGALSNHDPDKLVLLRREEYAHLDFMYGFNAKDNVYNPLVAFLRRH